jgi:hypothetical protein
VLATLVLVGFSSTEEVLTLRRKSMIVSGTTESLTLIELRLKLSDRVRSSGRITLSHTKTYSNATRNLWDIPR